MFGRSGVQAGRYLGVLAFVQAGILVGSVRAGLRVGFRAEVQAGILSETEICLISKFVATRNCHNKKFVRT